MSYIFCQNIKSSARLYRAAVIAVRAKSESKLPHYIEHATGIERQELIARAAGDDDPFGMKVVKRGPGTKENPNLVPSYEDKRIVGCICEEDQSHINYIWIHKDEMKRCGCGHWFKLVEAKPV